MMPKQAIKGEIEVKLLGVTAVAWMLTMGISHAAEKPFAVAETPASQLGKWHLNAGKSDQGKNPNPVLEAVLDVSTDDGTTLRFTLIENLKDGSKLSYKWDGAYDGVTSVDPECSKSEIGQSET